MTQPSSRHLVAPELLAGLDLFPKVDFALGLDPWRANLFERPPLPPHLAEVNLDERSVPGAPGAPEVRVLVYAPPGPARAGRPAMLDIHGGGYVIGSADMSDAANRTLALTHDCVVVSVDYRLAPETPWPGALEDCYAALCWLHANAEALGVDAARIAVGGSSAGGGHAAALAIHARNRARIDPAAPVPCFQLLDIPMLDDRTGTSADPHPYCGEFTWTAEHNRFGWGALLGMAPGGPDVPEAAVPARVQDLTGLPPAYILIGGLDLFLEESLDYARRLSRAGVPVELHVIPGGYHGFGLVQDAPQSRQSAALRDAALARAFAAGG